MSRSYIVSRGGTASVDVRMQGPRGVQGPRGPEGAPGLGSLYTLPAWKKSIDYRYFSDSGANTVIHVLNLGQSNSNGTLSGGIIDTTPLNPNHAKMLELYNPLVGSSPLASQQGPWIASYTPTGNVIPLKESFERAVPAYVDLASGQSITLSPNGMGETQGSGLINMCLDLQDQAGLPRSEWIYTSCGKGGEAYARIGPGNSPWLWFRRAVNAGAAYARSIDKTYIPVIWVDLGEDDSVFDSLENLTSERQALDYAARMEQMHYYAAQECAAAAGRPIEPLMFLTQVGTTYPSTFPPADGRLASVAEGQLIAAQNNRNIIVANPNYYMQHTDRLHGTMYGNRQKGMSNAITLMTALFGLGFPHALQMRELVRTGEREFVGVFDTSFSGPLRMQEYCVSEWAVSAAGSGYKAGDTVIGLGWKTAPKFKVLADGPLSAGNLKLIDQGSHPSDMTGTLTFLPQLAGATIATAGTGYLDGAIITIVGGTYTKPARLIIKANSSGVITSATVYDAGEYSVLPSNPVSFTGGSPQGAGSGASLNLVFNGSGGTLAVTCYKQAALGESIPYLATSLGIVAGGTGYATDQILTLIGGEAVSEDQRPQIKVNLTSVGGVVTSAILYKGGVMRSMPAGPWSWTGGTGTGFQTVALTSCHPVANPAFGGFNVIDDQSVLNLGNMTGLAMPAITSIDVVDWQGVEKCAVRIRTDVPPSRNAKLTCAQRSYGGNGPSSGARSNLASAAWPSSWLLS